MYLAYIYIGFWNARNCKFQNILLNFRRNNILIIKRWRICSIIWKIINGSTINWIRIESEIRKGNDFC